MHNVVALVLGVAPQDDPERGWVRREVCLYVLKELASGQEVLTAGASMHDQRMPLCFVTLQEAVLCG